MKKIIPFVLFLATLVACNNAADTVETKDSVNLDVNTGTDQDKDTSSYERMPNRITDSTDQ